MKVERLLAKLGNLKVIAAAKPAVLASVITVPVATAAIGGVIYYHVVHNNAVIAANKAKTELAAKQKKAKIAKEKAETLAKAKAEAKAKEEAAAKAKADQDAKAKEEASAQQQAQAAQQAKPAQQTQSNRQATTNSKGSYTPAQPTRHYSQSSGSGGYSSSSSGGYSSRSSSGGSSSSQSQSSNDHVVTAYEKSLGAGRSKGGKMFDPHADNKTPLPPNLIQYAVNPSK